jgi:hypothetical protein
LCCFVPLFVVSPIPESDQVDGVVEPSVVIVLTQVCRKRKMKKNSKGRTCPFKNRLFILLRNTGNPRCVGLRLLAFRGPFSAIDFAAMVRPADSALTQSSMPTFRPSLYASRFQLHTDLLSVEDILYLICDINALPDLVNSCGAYQCVVWSGTIGTLPILNMNYV